MGVPGAAGPAELLGRVQELSRLLADVAGLESGSGFRAVIVTGPAGIGKTSLVRAAAADAASRGFTILRADAAPAEVGLAYVALGDLLSSIDLGLVDALPAPQRTAIRVATLLEPAGAGRLDRRTVGAALLGLLRRLADRPLVIVIDDAQWLDSATADALAFATRRLALEPIALILGVREEEPDTPSPSAIRSGPLADALDPVGIDRIELGPLSPAVLFQLLRARLDHAFARPTLVRIAEWSDGNPLFALEIGRAIVDRGGALPPGAPPPVPRTLGQTLGARLAAMPLVERRALLVAASAPHPTSEVVAAACRRLRWPARLPPDGSLIRTVGPTLHWVHPLFAAAAIEVATSSERRAAHAALAGLAEQAEERARHLALAATGPDPAVAAALETAAADLVSRAAVAPAIELLELAAGLTPVADDGGLLRRRRLLGELLTRTGETRRAIDVLRTAVDDGRPDPERAVARAALAEVLAQDGSPEAAEQCRLAMDDAGQDPTALARAELAWCQTVPDARARLRHAQAALDLVSDDPPSLRARALAQVASATSTLGEPVPGALLEEAIRLEADWPPARLLDGAAAVGAWLHAMADELDLAHAEYEALRQRADQLGDDSSLGRILVELAQIDLRAGRWDELVEHATEAVRTAERAGRENDEAYAAIQLGALAAARGDRPTAERYLSVARRYQTRAGDLFIEAIIEGNLGALSLGEGDARAAARHIEAADRALGAAALGDTALGRFHGDRLEALVELGEVEAARSVAAEMEARARRNNRRRPQAFLARGRGFIAAASGDLDAALDAFDRSFAGLSSLGMRFEAARSQLARGIVRRRRREKRLAQEDLTAALGTFEALGATVWADRARRELARVGLRPRAGRDLTETERAVALLAADGRTNREIAAATFMSARTVEGVLNRAYGKLGIRSRAELGVALSLGPGMPGPRPTAAQTPRDTDLIGSGPGGRRS